MKELDDIKKYRIETTTKLVDKYRDLIDKIFTIAEKDLLDSEIKNAKDKDSEKKYLDKIKHREQALDQIQGILQKVETLERSIEEKEGDDDLPKKENDKNLHPTKRRSRN